MTTRSMLLALQKSHAECEALLESAEFTSYKTQANQNELTVLKLHSYGSYGLSMTVVKSINSLYKNHRFTTVGYIAEALVKKDYPEDPYELRAKYLTGPHMVHPMWRNNRLIELEYRYRLADSSIVGNEYYKLMFYDYGKLFLFDHDNPTLQILSGFNNCAPSVALKLISEEDVLLDAKLNAILPKDLHWQTLHPYTKDIFLSKHSLMWIWCNRYWLTDKQRDFIETNARYIIPDIWLPKCDYEVGMEDWYIISKLCEMQLSKGSKMVAKDGIKTSIYSPATHTLEVVDVSVTQARKFIGYEDSTVKSTKLPYYIEHQGANPGRGFFTSNNVITESIITTDMSKEVVETGDYSIFEVHNVDSPAHWSQFENPGYEVLPIFRVFQQTLPEIMQPAGERRFPYVPVISDPCIRRWNMLFKGAVNTQLFHVKPPIWNADTAKYENKLLTLKKGTVAHNTALAAYEKSLKLSSIDFLKKLPQAMKTQLNTISANWKLRAINAVNRVHNKNTADMVFIYLRGLLDEHERLEQLYCRFVYTRQLIEEITTESGLKLDEEFLELPWQQQFPNPPIMPYMGDINERSGLNEECSDF